MIFNDIVTLPSRGELYKRQSSKPLPKNQPLGDAEFLQPEPPSFEESPDDNLGTELIPEGKIEVSAMKSIHERYLVGGHRGVDEVTNYWIQNLTNIPKFGLNPDDLLVGDRVFLLLAIRNLSYGDAYSFRVTCDACLEPFKHNVSLSNLQINHLPEGFQEPYELYLPTAEKHIYLRLLRGRDERDLTRMSRQMQSKGEPRDRIVSLRYVKHVVNVDDPNIGQDKLAIEKFIDNLYVSDTDVIKEALNKITPAPNMFIEDIRCTNCGHYMEMSMPIQADFFRSRPTGMGSVSE